uniref:Uncharacterized protein n=1 Tax=viral metagenome TaxID=1070528 RepID=A0A6C0IU83_9ZZZZ
MHPELLRFFMHLDPFPVGSVYESETVFLDAIHGEWAIDSIGSFSIHVRSGLDHVEVRCSVGGGYEYYHSEADVLETSWIPVPDISAFLKALGKISIAHIQEVALVHAKFVARSSGMSNERFRVSTKSGNEWELVSSALTNNTLELVHRGCWVSGCVDPDGTILMVVQGVLYRGDPAVVLDTFDGLLAWLDRVGTSVDAEIDAISAA